MSQLDKKAYFMLPGFWEHFSLYKIMNEFFDKYPKAKREEAEIYCYYGNFSPCSWDGGRTFSSYNPADLESIQEVLNYYNKILNKKIRFVFTNNILEEKHCFDHYNNIILNLSKNFKNEIVLNSPILEEYLNKNFPEFELISSTTKCLHQTELAKKELNNSKYKFTCLDYNLNHNWSFLNSLTPEEKIKTEFLVNPICNPGCLQRKEHYRLNSLFSLNYGIPYKLKSCEIDSGSICAMFNHAHISPEDLYTTYLEQGFHYFKLEGRTWHSSDMAISCADYLIKPEYQTFFIRYVQERLR